MTKTMTAETHIVTEAKTLRARTNGPATAGIWLTVGGVEFPEDGWNDFVVVILGWWASAILRLMKRESQQEFVHFMDGPYAVEVSMTDVGKLRFRTLTDSGRGSEVSIGEAGLTLFIGELATQSRGVLDECRLQEWWSADAEALSVHVEHLERELKQFGGFGDSHQNK